MRVLFMEHDVAAPPVTGGRRRDFELIRRLVGTDSLTILAVVRSISRNDITSSTGFYSDTQGFICFEDDREPGLKRSSAEASAWLSQHSHEFDVIHVEGSYLVHLIPMCCRRKVVLVEHNIESQLLEQWKGLEEHQSSVVAEDFIFEGVSQSKLIEQERDAWRSVGTLVTLTDEDRRSVEETFADLPVSVVRNGTDHIPRPPAGRRISATRIGFLGNFTYSPNVDAAGEILRLLSEGLRLPISARRFLIAGYRNPFQDDKRIEAWSNLPEAGTFWDQTRLFVAPLRVGGGVKVKILEALSRGVPVITTPLGAQGIDRGLVRLASSLDEYQEAIDDLYNTGPARDEYIDKITLGRQSWTSWDEAARSIHRLWQRNARTESCHKI